MDLASLALLATVGAGYGVPVDGYPSVEERQLLLWTNAARVAPSEFEDEYQAGYEPCSFDDFESGEQEPKSPLYVDLDLTEAARYHSETMRENSCFQHESCDGSGETFDQRVAHYYDESSYLGENIAMGTTDPRYAVMGMWMCSSGHRANIMTGDYNEMGPGIDTDYLTQDFAAGTLGEGEPPVRVGVHDGDTFWADWGDDEAPEALQIVIDGVEHDMDLAFGDEALGIYTLAGEADQGEDCHPYYVWWETASGEAGTVPAEGSYLFGAGCDADWTEEQAPRGGLFGHLDEDERLDAMLEGIELVGCSTGGGAPAAILGAAGLTLALRRRRR